MERTDEAIKLFVKKHGKTPEDAGLPVIGFYEKQHAFLYAVSKDVIKAYKTQQNIIRWQTSWYVWLLAIVLLNYGDAFFRYQDVMHWRLLATYIFLVVWCVLGIVQWVRGKKFDRLIKLGDNITFLNDGALGDNITLLDDDYEPDPIPEPAEKLPYVYDDNPRKQVAHNIYFYSPFLGKETSIRFRPRKARGEPFDNVRGIRVADNLVLLRYIQFTGNLPGDIREMAKQYEGRFPNKAEIELIYAKFKEINQNLYECGEPLLQRWKYLYTSGNKIADGTMYYCLDFANGQDSFAECDDSVCAVLVEKSLPDAEQLKADTQAFKENHFNNPDLEEYDMVDVLCLVDGKKVRLPFSKRHLGEPIGIFPFKDEPEYLELDEVENKKHTDEDVDESRLPDEPFCSRVSKVVELLNLHLRAMDKPVLEGSYLADNSSYMPGCGWIIGFDNTGDYHGGSVPAKLRYMGRFEGKCQK